MNKYDLEHVCTAHGTMTQDEWQGVYQRAWLQYYSMEHIETLLRRAIADGIAAKRLMLSLVVFRGMPLIEKVHPLQGGYLRRKVRRTRRPGVATRQRAAVLCPALDAHAREAGPAWRTGMAGGSDSPPCRCGNTRSVAMRIWPSRSFRRRRKISLT